MKYLWILLLYGCANTPGNMSPEQIEADVKNKNSNVLCSNVAGIWGSGNNIYVNVDEANKVNGRVSATANKEGCVVTVDSVGQPIGVKP